MSSINKVMLIARLGRDPEVRYAPSGVAVCNVSGATSRSWKDKNTGEKVEETEWHRLVAYDRLAEVIGEYLKKGSLAYFEGRLKTRKWQDKEGVERFTTEIVVEQMQMLGGREGQAEGGEQPQRRAATAPAQRPAASAQQPRLKPTSTGTALDDMDDDIPFILSLNEYEVAPPKLRRLSRTRF